jgi:glycosyltransferase involved in cell wall biosynthesis
MTDQLRVAIVHYHFNPGGVTRVIDNAVTALRYEGIESAVLVGDVPSDTTFPMENVRLVDGLSYNTVPDDYVPSHLIHSLFSAAESVLGGPPDLWHFHNHTLGKNQVIPFIVRELAEEGHHLLLQIHDFAEDGRPSNYHLLYEELARADMKALGRSLYPQAAHVHYATLNGRDYRFMAGAGVPEERLHLLPNAIWMDQDQPHEPEPPPAHDGQFYLYPTRAIRRKNLGEFLLWAALGKDHERFATTLIPRNPVERKFHDFWVDVARELALPIEFGIGHSSRARFADLVRSADSLVTTSMAEGFGLAFLEPWVVGRPVMGRKIPEITVEFEEAGICLNTLYERLDVPVEWVGLDALRERVREGMASFLEAYGRSVEERDVEAAMGDMVNDGYVDFGRLDEPLQAKVIRKAAADSSLRDHISPSALQLPNDFASTVDHNRAIVLEQFGIEQYGTRLASIYGSVLKSAPEKPGPLDAAALLNRFLDPTRFTLLRT